jgi:hypothetical protein
VSKRTYYQHFASKTDLIEEYLRGIHEAGATLSEASTPKAEHRASACWPLSVAHPLAASAAARSITQRSRRPGRCPASTTSWMHTSVNSLSGSSRQREPAQRTRTTHMVERMRAESHLGRQPS